MRSISFQQLVFLVLSCNIIFASEQPKKRRSEGQESVCLEALLNAIDDDKHELIEPILKEKENCDINEIVPDGSGQSILMYSVLRGKSTEVLTTLLENGADVTIAERNGYTPIHGAAFQGRPHAAKLLLEHPKAKMDVNDKHKEDGFTPLHRACWGKQPRHTETARVLLEHGAEPDEPMCTDNPNGGFECVHIMWKTPNEATKELLTEWTKIDQYKREAEL